MAIGTLSKTVADSVYAYRFIRLMQKNFVDWDAFKEGIIDERGTVLKRPKTDAEKSAYTPFHASIRSLKRTLATVPGATTWTVLQSSLSAIGSRFGLTESDWTQISKEIPLFEGMIAGDAGNGTGSPESIASGTTTGDVVNASPGVMGTSKRKRKIIGKI